MLPDSQTAEQLTYWAAAAMRALRSGINVYGVETARAEVSACLQQVDALAAKLPANEQGHARVLSRSLARATALRLSGELSAENESELDVCIYWAGKALDWADGYTRCRTEDQRIDALLHAGECLGRAEVARVLLARDHRHESDLALRLIQAAREAVHDVVSATGESEAA